MAKRGIPVTGKGYKPGSHYAICDRCASQFRAEELRETWEGWWVCDEDWEKRHEQDFLRVKEEKIAADQPLRNEDLSNQINPWFAYQNPPVAGQQSAIAGVAIAGVSIAGAPSMVSEANAHQVPAGTFNNEI